jgi:hypothetical protein
MASAIVNESDLDKSCTSQQEYIWSLCMRLGTFCVRCCILMSLNTIDAPRIVLRTVGNMNGIYDVRIAVPSDSLNIQRTNLHW